MAGGGTGGHIFPGIAVALKLKALDPGCSVLYVGAKMGMEEKLVPKYGIDLELLNLGGIKGKSLVMKLINLAKLVPGIARSIRIITRFKPDVVFGVGGYASYPTLFASKLLMKKTAILEQNTVAGLANRVLGILVDRVYVAFEYSQKFFPAKKTVYTGNPIREEVINRASQARKDGGRFVIFVFGGSQGSSNLNRRVIESLDRLGNLKEKIEFIHQTGERDYESVRAAYEKSGFKAHLFAFTDDMGSSFAKSDFIISRSGSGVCEIAAMGKPSLLVPYPNSSYGHQDMNADWLVNAGGAYKIPDKDLSGEAIAKIIMKLFTDRGKLKAMGKSAFGLAKPDAAVEIAKNLLALAHGGGAHA
jgi:UDP-N-acetylglucosamine--N-acetylmuramyl-(pentapeptide) pyrophosphoryl-undecaprenol N-acetylglucosamine transferase